MRLKWFGLAVVGVAATACSEAVTSRSAFLVRDSAGIRIATSSQPRHADTIRFGEDPVVVIPGDFGAPDYFLDDVDYVIGRTPRGLVVGNGGSRELFLFDDHGDFVRAVGGAATVRVNSRVSLAWLHAAQVESSSPRSNV